ncbi:MAG TPA: DedA family protein [Thermomicrobiales bacterium]|jgi:membrane protein DedA with SNARE-associated domain
MTDAVVGLMRAFGYLGLFLVLIIENLFPPIPSEAVLPLAGFLVGRGEMNFGLAVAVATAGGVVGALILYALGRWGGRPLILRYGWILRVDAASLDRAERWFTSYGDWVVLVARVIPLARSIVSIPAGTMRMPLLRFTVLTTIGTGLWNIILIGAGQLLGENWEEVSNVAATYSDVGVGLLGLGVVAFGVYYLFRRRIKQRQA